MCVCMLYACIKILEILRHTQIRTHTQNAGDPTRHGTSGKNSSRILRTISLILAPICVSLRAGACVWVGEWVGGWVGGGLVGGLVHVRLCVCVACVLERRVVYCVCALRLCFESALVGERVCMLCLDGRQSLCVEFVSVGERVCLVCVYGRESLCI